MQPVPEPREEEWTLKQVQGDDHFSGFMRQTDQC